MSCKFFLAQIQNAAQEWKQVGEPCSTEAAADLILVPYSGNPRVLGTRVIQSSCEKIKEKKGCCGGR